MLDEESVYVGKVLIAEPFLFELHSMSGSREKWAKVTTSNVEIDRVANIFDRQEVGRTRI